MPFPSNESTLLKLPLEIRESIYGQVLRPHTINKHEKPRHKFDIALFRVNSQVSKESQTVFNRTYFTILFQANSAVLGNLATENRVPIIHSGKRARLCKSYIMKVEVRFSQIGGGSSSGDGAVADYFHTILLLEDLPKFCKTWLYSYGKDSTWYKKFILEINDNGSAIFRNGTLPLELQKKLLIPFGVLEERDLAEIKGNWHNPSVEDALRQMTKTPEASPLERLEESNRLKDSGNEALSAGELDKALNLYIQALDELFVICSGRWRKESRRAYFDVVLKDSPFQFDSGMAVYYLLRAKSSANILQVYLKMEKYEETLFWGNRAIQTMREMQGSYDDELGRHTPANDTIGRIFYRTGVAARVLGDESEARQLLRVAEKYLPRDEHIKDELRKVRLCIG